MHSKFVDTVARRFLEIRARMGSDVAKEYARHHLANASDEDTDRIAARITELTKNMPDPRSRA